MVMKIYGRAFAVLMRKPLKLWGISLLSVVLMSVGTALCGVAIPILGIALSMLLSTSMTMIYLAGYRGKKVETVQLFSCFKDWETIKRVLLGMGWMLLWVMIWSLIPIVGPFIGIVKAYAFRLTPYILVMEPDVSVTDAIKISEKRTYGYKGKMFLADFLVYILVGAVNLVLALLGGIRYIGILFALIGFLFSLASGALMPLFMGLVQAAFYEEIKHPSPNSVRQAPTAPAYPSNGYPQAPQGQAPQYQAPQRPAAPQYQAPQRPAQAPQYQAPQRPAQAPQRPAQPTQPAAGRVCPRCGAQIASGARFCTNCGSQF